MIAEVTFSRACVPNPTTTISSIRIRVGRNVTFTVFWEEDNFIVLVSYPKKLNSSKLSCCIRFKVYCPSSSVAEPLVVPLIKTSTPAMGSLFSSRTRPFMVRCDSLALSSWAHKVKGKAEKRKIHKNELANVNLTFSIRSSIFYLSIIP